MENKLNRIQKFGLVALRMVIGWHFLYEGVAKLMKGNWSAAGFLMQSKGIFAGIFQGIAANEGLLAIVNQLNIWGLIAIGLGLMLGLFTRMASLFGMLLILLYYVCNPLLVGYYYSIPMEGNYLVINKNIVEFAALFLIAITYSGYYAGLDRIIYKLRRKKS